ncbi:MAG: EamA family transporter [Clostridia bacterium]|nr:EamA family transporter [Clostridia bacterium]
MGYLYLGLALLAGAGKGFCGKRTSGLIKGFKGAALSNMIRMGFCVLFGLIMVIAGGEWGQMAQNWTVIGIAALSGVSTAVLVITWLVSARKSAYMLMDVFYTLAVLIPLILSAIFFDERIKWTQWVGVCILFAAVLLLCSYNNSVKTRLTPSALLILIVSGISNGLGDFSQKLFVKTSPEVPVSVFNLYTYLFAFLCLVIFLLFLKSDEKIEENAFRKIVGYIAVMALCLFAYSYFKTTAAGLLDSVLLYPLSQGAGMIIATTMAAVFFGEKITPRCLLGVATAFVGLLIINLL